MWFGGEGEQAEAKALLETDELIVRAPFKISVPRGAITAARADGDRLTVEWPQGAVELELGEREAARWANDIVNPKTVADKLGVKAGQRVLVVGDSMGSLSAPERRSITDQRTSCSWRSSRRPIWA